MTEKIASLFCVGLSGPTLNDDDRRVLERGVGGIVLFARNVQSRTQVAQLIDSARQLAGPDLLACVDQEGGRVARLVDGFTRLPAMRTLGNLAAEQSVKEAEQLAFEMGQCLGQELRETGFDMNLAPVLDVDTNPDNPVIGDRSIGSDPQVVARLGQQLIEGMYQQGIAACGKHFPGHGDTAQDSHYDLPRLPHSMERLQDVELLPFQYAADHLHPGDLAIMSAHVIFEAIDPTLPATLCRKVMTDLLRDQMGFNGLRLSDCMEMKAIADGTDWDGTVGATVQAIQAGVDLVLVSHTHELMHAAIDRAAAAAGSGQLSAARVAEALEKLEAVRDFRRAARSKDFPAFVPSKAFEQLIQSSTAQGDDPTWGEVDPGG